jgi:hypothetical protein
VLCITDLSWLENEAFEDMYERAGFMTTDDGALVMLAGSTLGGGEARGSEGADIGMLLAGSFWCSRS